jgi:hypothetical protein
VFKTFVIAMPREGGTLLRFPGCHPSPGAAGVGSIHLLPGGIMKTFTRYAGAVALAGAFALAAATPSQARWHGRHGGGAAVAGFAAGALIGAAAANSYYGPDYYGPDYAYAPGYAYEPGYDSYAYEPGPTVYRYRSGSRPSCATDGGYGRTDYGAC